MNQQRLPASGPNTVNHAAPAAQAKPSAAPALPRTETGDD